MLLMIDNYDSFTYNLVQKLGEVAPNVPIEVFRNDKVTIPQIEDLKPTHVSSAPARVRRARAASPTTSSGTSAPASPCSASASATSASASPPARSSSGPPS